MTKMRVGLVASLVFGAIGACSSFSATADHVDDDAGALDATSGDAPTPPAVPPTADAPFEDAPQDAGAGCGTRLSCVRTVFVTKTTFTGNLGTVTGADQICQQAADATDHPMVVGRRFIAWISDAVSTPAMRIAAQGQAPYVLPNGVIVAGDWAGLASGQHQHEINVDPFGTVASVVSSHAWTGASPDGSALGGQCNGWTSASDAGSGHRGDITAINATWSNEGESPCFTEARLYCIER